jgi:carboxylesterase type B
MPKQEKKIIAICNLGFLNLGTPVVSGNFGLKDQVATLKWVKNNIQSFGGDPNNVTLFGESGGGVSIHYLLISPLAKGKMIILHGQIFLVSITCYF